MKNSTELNAVHEPFTDSYYFGPDRKSDRYGDRDPDSFISDREAIETAFFKQSIGLRAFVKELAFQGEPYISDDILRESHQLMITRHPAAVYASLIKLKPDFTEDEFGFTALWRLRDRLRRLGVAPFVIDGDDFRSNPTEITTLVCEKISIMFDPEMLFWSEGGIRNWQDGEEKSQAIWHNTLESSKTIIKPDKRITSTEVLPEHAQWYKNALRIYEGLLSAGHTKWGDK
jgi:hypothetical protein